MCSYIDRVAARSLRRVVMTVCCVSAFCFVAMSSKSSLAAPLEIFFTELDIKLDSGTIVDADPGGGDPDPLRTATIRVGGFSATFSTGIFADLSITDVPPLFDGVPVIAPAPAVGSPNTFDLTFAGGEFLSLELGDVSITYIDILDTVQFVFAASVASSFSQDLPFGIGFEPDAPVSLSFSTQVKDGTRITDGAGGIIGFLAAGTGEVRGVIDPDTQNLIPEPATLGMVALASLMGTAVYMRRRLG